MRSAPSFSAHGFDDEEDDEGPQNPKLSSSYDAAIAQEAELLLHRSYATPLSPQSSASAAGPRLLGPTVRVWDPCNLLLRPPPPPDAAAEVLLVAHGECGDGAPRVDLVGGRRPGAALTAAGRRQARALAVLLGSRGVRFSAVCSSPLDDESRSRGRSHQGRLRALLFRHRLIDESKHFILAEGDATSGRRWRNLMAMARPSFILFQLDTDILR